MRQCEKCKAYTTQPAFTVCSGCGIPLPPEKAASLWINETPPMTAADKDWAETVKTTEALNPHPGLLGRILYKLLVVFVSVILMAMVLWIRDCVK